MGSWHSCGDVDGHWSVQKVQKMRPECLHVGHPQREGRNSLIPKHHSNHDVITRLLQGFSKFCPKTFLVLKMPGKRELLINKAEQWSSLELYKASTFIYSASRDKTRISKFLGKIKKSFFLLGIMGKTIKCRSWLSCFWKILYCFLRLLGRGAKQHLDGTGM